MDSARKLSSKLLPFEATIIELNQASGKSVHFRIQVIREKLGGGDPVSLVRNRWLPRTKVFYLDSGEGDDKIPSQVCLKDLSDRYLQTMIDARQMRVFYAPAWLANKENLPLYNKDDNVNRELVKNG